MGPGPGRPAQLRWTTSTLSTTADGRERLRHRHRDRTAHQDFGGRAWWAPTPRRRPERPTATGTARTSPAPSAARRTAWPRARTLVAVRVLDCAGRRLVERYRRHRLGDQEREAPAVANMSLGGAADARWTPRSTPRSTPASPWRSPRATKRGRLQLLARPRGRRPSPSAPPTTGPAGDVLQLRHVRRPVRAGRGHHLGRHTGPDGDHHHQRNVDGHAARGRWGRAVPGRPPDATPADVRPHGPCSRRTTMSDMGAGSPNQLLYVGKVDPAQN